MSLHRTHGNPIRAFAWLFLFLALIGAGETYHVYGLVWPSSARAGFDELATDSIGQIDGADTPIYTKNAANNTPNARGFGSWIIGVALDSVHHRLFVTDHNNYRVLVYNLDSSNQLVDRVADNVIGQLDFRSNVASVDQVHLRDPAGLAYDPNHNLLFVADGPLGFACRIMVFDVSTITNGMSAAHVIGRPSFFDSSCDDTPPLTQSGTRTPNYLAYDAVHDRLFDSESSGPRVLVWDLANGITDGMNASHVLGQFDFQTQNVAMLNSPVGERFYYPTGLAYDDVNDRLFVGDNALNRVTVFNVASGSMTDGETADGVLGAPDLTTRGTFDTTQDKMSFVLGLAYDSANSRLFIVDNGNYRTLVFSAPLGFTNGKLADNELGQTGFTTADYSSTTATGSNDPTGVAYDPGNQMLYVTENNNRRVVKYDVNAITNGEPAVDGLGQLNQDDTMSFVNNLTDNAPNAQGFDIARSSVVDPVGHRLFVSDLSNNRVLVFNLNASNQLLDHTADYVLGQANMRTNAAATTKAGLSLPSALAFDAAGNRLFVAETANNRVMVFDVSSITDGMDAVHVLGQTDFVTAASGTTQKKFTTPNGLAYDATGHRLFVADYNNNRVMVFDVSSITDGQNATHVLGQTDFTSFAGGTTQAKLNLPYGAAYDDAGHRLFVSDTNNSRIMVYDVAAITDGENAVNVLGQTDFVTPTTGTTQGKLNTPRGIAFDAGGNRVFVADSANNRVMVFDVSSITDGQNATELFGQNDFTSSGSNTTQSAFSLPVDVSWDATSTDLFVADSGNNRIMMFTNAPPTPTPTATPVVGGSTHVTPPSVTGFVPVSVTVNSGDSSTDDRNVFVTVAATFDDSFSGTVRVLLSNDPTFSTYAPYTYTLPERDAQGAIVHGWPKTVGWDLCFGLNSSLCNPGNRTVYARFYVNTAIPAPALTPTPQPLASLSLVRATFADTFSTPFTNCFRDADCAAVNGYCQNRVCKSPASNAPPICADRCSTMPYCPSWSTTCGGHSVQVNGTTVHVTDCRGIATGAGGGVISYCSQPATAPTPIPTPTPISATPTPIPTPTPTPTPVPLTISPSSLNVLPNVTALLQAFGGTGTYSWSATGGTIVGTGSQIGATFTNGSTSATSQAVTVTSGAQQATASVQVSGVTTFQDSIDLLGQQTTRAVIVNGGMSTTGTPTVTLTLLHGFTQVASSSIVVQISNSLSGLSSAPVQPYQKVMPSWNICPDPTYCPSDLYTVYAIFTAPGGVQSPVTMGSIAYLAPSSWPSWGVTVDGGTATGTGDVTLHLNPWFDQPGTQVLIGNTPDLSNVDPSTFSATTSWNVCFNAPVPCDAGVHTVYIQFSNPAAGWTTQSSPVYEANATYTPGAPVPTPQAAILINAGAATTTSRFVRLALKHPFTVSTVTMKPVNGGDLSAGDRDLLATLGGGIKSQDDPVETTSPLGSIPVSPQLDGTTTQQPSATVFAIAPSASQSTQGIAPLQAGVERPFVSSLTRWDLCSGAPTCPVGLYRVYVQYYAPTAVMASLGTHAALGDTASNIYTDSILLAAATPAPTPSATPTPTPSATPTPVPSVTPTPSATPLISGTPAPAVTPATSPGASPSPLSVFLTSAQNVIEAIGGALQGIGAVVAPAQNIVVPLAVASTVVVGAAAATALVPILATSGSGVFAFGWQWLLGVFGLLPKRKKIWGTVYDANTKRPIPFATVQLLDRNRRVLETRTADKDGRYGFLTTPESLQAQNMQILILAGSNGYHFPSMTPPSIDTFVYNNLYYGALITVTADTLINFDIPMDPLRPSAAPLVLKSPSIALGASVAAVADAGFWVGLVMIPLSFLATPNPFTFGTLCLFLGVASLRLFGITERPFGTVTDAQTGRPMPFTLITLNDPTGKRVAFTVSDERGRYFLIVQRGMYELTAYTSASVIPPRQARKMLSVRKGWITQSLKI